MAAKAMAAGLNIDYYPTNFVVQEGLVWYVDYECNDYSEQWDFEHWGIQYWQPQVSFRSYRDEDYEAVCDFLIELNQKGRTHINWNWARFEWMMEHPEFDKSASSSIGLWWSDGRVVGAAIYDMYFGEAFCGVLPGHETLYPDILDYACRELKDDSGLAIAINNDNAAEIKAALQAGFERIDQKETIMELSLDRTFSLTLPEELQLREMDQIADWNALEWLFWQGFDHGDDREAFERSLDHVPHVRRHFNKALSLCSAEPSGEPVSHCSLWFHPDTDYAYVEPVCTIPGYRGKGIAAALLSEAFSRAKALGAKKAYVISDLPFYEKLGFEKAQHYSFYRKEKREKHLTLTLWQALCLTRAQKTATGGTAMLKIGEFSKLSRVSVRMLRHYDEIGLLKPAEIDRFTDYRYYREDQLPIAGRIAALKDMGFSLADIVRILEVYDDREKLEPFFSAKREELEALSKDTA